MAAAEAPRPFFVYFLRNRRESYIGFTVNLRRRLRQHRKELKGGAKRTGRWENPAETEMVGYVTGFPDKNIALSYEWHAKRRIRGTKKQHIFPRNTTHPRLEQFFHTITHEKFKRLTNMRAVLVGNRALVPMLEALRWFHSCISVTENDLD